MVPQQAKARYKLDPGSAGYLEHAMEEMNFSARTTADLAGSVEQVHPRVPNLGSDPIPLAESETLFLT